MKLEDLYRQVIMEHYKNPRNKGLLERDGYHKVHLHNPSCGDDIEIQIYVLNGIIKDIRQAGTGCSICCSSASVMSETLKEHTISKSKTLIADFLNMIQGIEITEDVEEELGEAIAYKGVSQFPARIKCATLAWKACEKALEEVDSNEE